MNQPEDLIDGSGSDLEESDTSYPTPSSVLGDIKKMTLGDRMKEYENEHNQKINPEDYFCVRLDGHSFSKFTRGLPKPFDSNFSKAMVTSAYDAMLEFKAVSAYTQSDEITLIFNHANLIDKQPHIYDGRKQKIISLTSSFISVRFNYHFNKFVEEDTRDYKPEVIEKIREHRAFFDARLLVFNESNKQEILNHLIWRSARDCHRNAISMYAQSMYAHKELQGLNGAQMIEMINKKVSWESVPLWQKYGVFLKKELVEIKNDHVVFQRSKMTGISFDLHFSEANLDFFMADYYTKPDSDKIEIYPLIDTVKDLIKKASTNPLRVTYQYHNSKQAMGLYVLNQMN